MDKNEIRQKILSERRQLSKQRIQADSCKIIDNIFNWSVYRLAKNIMVYLSMPDEPQTDDIIVNALQSGKKVCVPYMRQEFGVMDAVFINNLNDLVLGRLNVREPNPLTLCIADPLSIDLVLVPGIAFDCSGNRIGFGAGYYDRYLRLAKQAVFAGLAWPFQMVTKIPVSTDDVAVHYIITGAGLYSCDEGRM